MRPSPLGPWPISSIMRPRSRPSFWLIWAMAATAPPIITSAPAAIIRLFRDIYVSLCSPGRSATASRAQSKDADRGPDPSLEGGARSADNSFEERAGFRQHLCQPRLEVREARGVGHAGQELLQAVRSGVGLKRPV